MLEQAIKESTKQAPKQTLQTNDLELELQRAIEESKKEAMAQYPPGVQQVINAGFPVDSVLTAFSIVGDDPDLIINFIYENS